MSIPGEFLLVATLMAATGIAAVTEAATPAQAPVAPQVAQVAQAHSKTPQVTVGQAVLILAQR